MKNCLAEGKGVMFYANGNRYEGDFINDLPDGQGIFYYNNGDREMGDYSKGKKINMHIKINNDGCCISTKKY